MESFYLTLSSSSDGHFAAGNTASRFRVHLGRPLNLKGPWMLGLAECHVPSSLVCERKTTIAGDESGIKMTVTDDSDDPKCNLLFLHCNLITDHAKDHGHHRVIRTLNVKRDKYKKGVVRTYSFGKIFYYPVSKSHVSDIDVYISTDKGREASFTEGTLTLLLHFKPGAAN